MGTSKSYEGIKGNPNWSKLSGSVTRACDTGSISTNSLNKVVSNFAQLLGGSSYGGRGHSKIGGWAGIRTAQKLGGFLSDVKSNGFIPTLSGIGFNITNTTKANDAINYLLEYCAGIAFSLDDTAAKAAEKHLLEEIGSEAKTVEELEKNFDEKVIEYGVEELIIRFFAHYIHEHLFSDFYEKLIKEKGKKATSNLFIQLKNFIFERIKNVSRKRDLSKIDWAGKDGNELVKNIFEDTLKEFEDYES